MLGARGRGGGLRRQSPAPPRAQKRPRRRLAHQNTSAPRAGRPLLGGLNLEGGQGRGEAAPRLQVEQRQRKSGAPRGPRQKRPRAAAAGTCCVRLRPAHAGRSRGHSAGRPLWAQTPSPRRAPSRKKGTWCRSIPLRWPGAPPLARAPRRPSCLPQTLRRCPRAGAGGSRRDTRPRARPGRRAHWAAIKQSSPAVRGIHCGAVGGEGVGWHALEQPPGLNPAL